MIIKDLGNTFETFKEHLGGIAEQLAEKYPAQKKGIFFSSDTQANIFLNILIRKHGMLPEDILIVGFDNSPVSREAIIPISTVGQQTDVMAYEAVKMLVEQMNERKKRRPALLKEPVHKAIAPVLFKRETTERGKTETITLQHHLQHR